MRAQIRTEIGSINLGLAKEIIHNTLSLLEETNPMGRFVFERSHIVKLLGISVDHALHVIELCENDSRFIVYMECGYRHLTLRAPILADEALERFWPDGVDVDTLRDFYRERMQFEFPSYLEVDGKYPGQNVEVIKGRIYLA